MELLQPIAYHGILESRPIKFGETVIITIWLYFRNSIRADLIEA